MNAPHTALRNRRIIWGSSPHRLGGDQLSGAGHAPAPADRRDAGDHHCVCSSDHCTGTPGNEYCRGTDADGGAHGAAALDLGSSAFNPSTISYLDAGARCCNDAADCADPHCGSAHTADGTA